MTRLAALATLAALALLALAASGRTCATVATAVSHVPIAAESALIVWDEKTKTQHFIRRASFEAREPYFGFLVPTPTEPKLAEAPDALFTQMEGWIRPEVHTVKVALTLRQWW